MLLGENDGSSVKYPELFNLMGYVTVVTGGAGLLGSHFCEGLAQFGSNVAILDLLVEDAERLAEKLNKKYGTKCIGYSCDITDAEIVNNVVDKIIRDFGEVNVLVNNVAAKSKKLKDFFNKFEDYSLSQWREIMSANLDGMFLVAQAIGKRLVAQKKGGSIIQISSIYGVVAPDQRIYEDATYLDVSINTPAVYSASKAGVIGLTKYLSTYWSSAGIRVNTLSPGGVASGQNDAFNLKYSLRTPMNRMAKASEMVCPLIFLASNASSYITGQNIIVDGGLTSW